MYLIYDNSKVKKSTKEIIELCKKYKKFKLAIYNG